jgi:osmotically-inducible protein OsmY
MRISAVFVITLAILTGCSQSDRERAQERAKEASAKADSEMHKLGNDAKADARKLNSEIQQGMNSTSTRDANAKLDHAAQIARTEMAEAGRKLDRAGVIASVKAKLAADVGLTTMSNVRVDANGSTVILSGTVSTADQRRLAEQAASQVDGVAKVRNQIQVQP